MVQPTSDNTAVTETATRLQSAKRKFLDTLRAIFQFDAADLDFGIYRILNMRRERLEKFLAEELAPQVEALLDEGGKTARRRLVDQQNELAESLLRFGIKDFSQSEDWVQNQAKLASLPDTTALAREVFSDLTTFFGRYYEDGDFMALPRYKGDTYAIPYDGSEVKLHWANADQYYVKSMEVFGNYRVRLDGLAGSEPFALSFKLVQAESDRDNNKASEKRRFVLREEKPFAATERELTCFLEWRAVTTAGGKTPKQEDLNEQAEKRILADDTLPKDWKLALQRRTPQDGKLPVAEQRSAFAFQLYRYTRKQSSDYFIHKDLDGFLRRELDFFLKNEVLGLDDIDRVDDDSFVLPLRKVRAIRAVALKIITWLAQVEDFQKRLYLKKKFVLKTNLFASQLSFREQPSAEARKTALDLAAMMAFGTAKAPAVPIGLGTTMDGDRPAVYFVQGETVSWLSRIDNVDDHVSGLMVKGDNFHALRLLKEKYSGRIDCTYIDPPYNAKTSEILYRNGYKHSSWIAMMSSRLREARPLSRNNSIIIAIDENEHEALAFLLETLYVGNKRTSVTVIHNPRGIQGKNFSYSHEYAVFCFPDVSGFISGTEIPSSEWDFSPLRNWGGESLRSDGPNCFYPIVVTRNGISEIGTPADEALHPAGRCESLPGGRYRIWPIDNGGIERKWRYASSTLARVLHATRVVEARGGGFDIQIARYQETPKTVWSDPKYDAGTHGTRLLSAMLPVAEFSFPKSIHLVTDCISVVIGGHNSALVLDFFGGSGTTGHAVVALNRRDNGRRSFVLVEMGDYFDSVLVPRVLKASIAPEWKDGQPSRLEPVEALYKIIELESYDDTLENLELRAPELAVQQALDLNAEAGEQYLLRYLLELESDGSLLDLKRFEKPWNYTIKVRRGGMVETSPVDLVETFNYLLGLNVQSYDTFGQDDLLFVRGKIRAPAGDETQGDRKVLVIWRDCQTWDATTLNEAVRRYFGRVTDDARRLPLDEYDAIYINGDHHLANVLAPDGRARLLPIEETFHRLMFDTSDEA